MNKTIGTWLGTPNKTFVELAIKLGYDWIVIDLEHSGINLNFCDEVIAITANSSIEIYIRVPDHDPALIKKVLDLGANGIVAPMVETRKQLLNLRKFMHYAPKGKRGLGLNRAHGFNLEFDEYLKKSVSLKLIAQVESKNAIKNISEIIDRELIDAAIIGPYDLSSSYYTPGSFDTLDMKKALTIFLDECNSKDVLPGYHVVSSNPDEVNKKISEGYKFIAYGVDFIFLQESMRIGLNKIIKN